MVSKKLRNYPGSNDYFRITKVAQARQIALLSHYYNNIR